MINNNNYYQIDNDYTKQNKTQKYYTESSETDKNKEVIKKIQDIKNISKDKILGLSNLSFKTGLVGTVVMFAVGLMYKRNLIAMAMLGGVGGVLIGNVLNIKLKSK